MKKSTDTARISVRTGFKKELVDKVKEYTIEKHAFIEDELFEYDPYIALSWQRLAEGTIQHCDITMLEHEFYELTMKQLHPNWSHLKAHEEAQKVFNYQKEVNENYGNLEKCKKNR